MFDIPDAKRVRREDLLSSRSSHASSRASSLDIDPGLAAAYHERLASLFGNAPVGDYSIIAEDKEVNGEDGEGTDGKGADGEEEFAFRLFGGEDARRIVIKEEDLGTGALVRGSRDPRVFILEKAQGEDRARFESMAVSGDEVLRGREKRAWGLEVPWRVIVWKDKGRGKEADGDDKKQVILDGKRRKPGKKRRILLREKTRKVEEARKRREEGEREKEEREREKRTRRNREKKVKRKLKEKAKKAGGAGDGDGDGDGDGGRDIEGVDMDEGSE